MGERKKKATKAHHRRCGIMSEMHFDNSYIEANWKMDFTCLDRRKSTKNWYEKAEILANRT